MHLLKRFVNFLRLTVLLLTGQTLLGLLKRHQILRKGTGLLMLHLQHCLFQSIVVRKFLLLPLLHHPAAFLFVGSANVPPDFVHLVELLLPCPHDLLFLLPKLPADDLHVALLNFLLKQVQFAFAAGRLAIVAATLPEFLLAQQSLTESFS